MAMVSGWVRGIREVTHVDGQRVVRELGARDVADALSRSVMAVLPAHKSHAGPCGTSGEAALSWNAVDPLNPAAERFLLDSELARIEVLGASAIAWSLRMLWPQLVRHYAARGSHHPKKLGARTGPRGREPSGAVP